MSAPSLNKPIAEEPTIEQAVAEYERFIAAIESGALPTGDTPGLGPSKYLHGPDNLAKFNPHHDEHGRFAEGIGRADRVLGPRRSHPNSPAAARRAAATPKPKEKSEEPTDPRVNLTLGRPTQAKVTYNAGRNLNDVRRSMGRPDITDSDLLHLMGGEDERGIGLSVSINPTQAGDEVYVIGGGGHVDGPGWIRTFDASGTIHNEELFLKESAPRGTGTKMLAREVDTAARLGFTDIETFGSRSDDKEMPANGYYTWPRLGYDAKLADANWQTGREVFARTELAKHFPGATKVSDLMKTPQGRDWWKANGQGMHLTFDLSAGSLSRRTLDSYMAEHGYKLDKGAWVSLTKYNEHHDAHGRFASGGDKSTTNGAPSPNALPAHAHVDYINHASLSDVRAALDNPDVTDSDLLAMMGGLDEKGNTISVTTPAGYSPDDIPRAVYLDGDGPYVEDWQRSVSSAAPRTMINDYLRLRDDAPPGMGARMLAQQADALERLGFEKIICEAEGGQDKDGRPFNGYYSWPRLGYDGPIPREVLRDMPAQFQGARHVSELMRTKEGRDYWKQHGTTFPATFTLAKGSASRRILAAYLEEKHLSIDKLLRELNAWDSIAKYNPNHDEHGRFASGGDSKAPPDAAASRKAWATRRANADKKKTEQGDKPKDDLTPAQRAAATRRANAEARRAAGTPDYEAMTRGGTPEQRAQIIRGLKLCNDINPQLTVRIHASDDHQAQINGETVTAAGTYDQQETTLNVYPGAFNASKGWVNGLVVHEMQHGRFADVRTAMRGELYEIERKGVDRDQWDDKTGPKTQAARDRFPIAAEVYKYQNDPDIAAQLKSSDGVTSYSQKWWRAMAGNARAEGWPADSALNETLSEIASLKVQGETRTRPTAQVWKDYDAAMDRAIKIVRTRGH